MDGAMQDLSLVRMSDVRRCAGRCGWLLRQQVDGGGVATIFCYRNAHKFWA
jgi:hypothetical protein